MRRLVGLILTLVMLLSLAGSNSLAADAPSIWAIEEVQAAIDGGMVPLLMQNNYQVEITRVQYVLLALELLEDAGVETDIVYERPFSDIEGHMYQREILIAFNAGLINGYEDGTFRPDRLITRQEIATLVVNLVRIVDPDEAIGLSQTYEYGDSELIGNWAEKNIDYCYAKKIIRGIGQDKLLRDIIDPLGNTTIEQAILLLYRLSILKGLYSELPYKKIVIEEGLEDRTLTFNEFAEKAEASAKIIYNLQSKSYAFMQDSTSAYAEVGYIDGSDLSISLNDPVEIRLELTSPDNRVMINTFKSLVEAELGLDVATNVSASLFQLENETDISLSYEIDESTTFDASSFEAESDEGDPLTIVVLQVLSSEQ